MKNLVVFTAAILSFHAMNAQDYVKKPISYLYDWVNNDLTREEIKNDLPAAFHVAIDKNDRLILEKTLEDAGDGVEEIQIEFDANGHIELIRSSHEPIALKTLKSDISQLGFNMNEENRHKGYTEYEYVRPGSEIELNLLVSEVDKQITSLVISKYAKD